MILKDGEKTIEIHTMRDGNTFWLGISKDGVVVANPEVTPNELKELINDLIKLYKGFIEI